MSEAMTSGKYGVLVMVNIEGVDAVWRNGAIYELQKADLRNNLLSVFSSFLNDRHSRNLVNCYISDWFLTERGVPQGCILSPFISVVYTADLTMEDTNSSNPNVSSQTSSRKSKYADDVEFWRTHTDIY